MDLGRGINYGAKGAALGGTVGTIVPGVGTAIGAGVGGVGGLLYGLFSDDEQAAADAEKRAQLEAAKRAYAAYRPEMAQARMAAMQNQLNAYGGVSKALQKMYGSDMGLNLNAPPVLRR
jgi:hypothetical protein